MTHSKLTNIFLDQIKEPVWFVSADFRLMYANKAYHDLITEFTGKERKLEESVFEESDDQLDVETWKAHYRRGFEGAHFEIEEHLLKNIKYSRITFEPLIGEAGKVVAVSCRAIPVSQSTRHKSDVQQLSDLSLDVFCTVNQQGEFISVSGASKSLWGYTPDELIGKHYQTFVLEEDSARSTDVEKAIIGGQNTKSFINRYRRKDGGIAYNLWSATWDENSNLIYAVARDVTEKIEQEEKILLSQKRFEALVENSMDCVVIFSKEGDITYATKSIKDMLGYSVTEIIGVNFKTLIHPEDITTAENAFSLSIQSPGQAIKGYVSRLRHKNGSWRWIEPVMTNLLHDPSVMGIVDNFRDITDEKNLRELNREVGKLVKIGSWEIDLVNSTAFWSDEIHQIYGTDPHSFVPSVDAAINFYREDYRELARLSYEKCIETQEPYTIEAVIINVHQEEVWVQTTAKAEYVDGVCTRVYGSFQDINERKLAEQEKTRLQETIENSLNEIYTFDAKTLLFTYTNRGARKNLGYSEQEIAHLTPIDLKPDYTLSSFNALVKPLMNKEKEKIIFFTNHKRKDGSLYPVEVHLQLFEEGKDKRFLAIILDITERKKAEEENRFKANLLSTIGQAAIATKLDGTVSYWNKAAENIYGWTSEEALGQNIMDLTPIEDNRLQAQDIMEVLKKGHTWMGEFKVKRKDGKSFIVMVANSPTYNEDNVLSGMIGISTDISERVKSQQLLKQYTFELERSNQELEQFAYVASHDLQEPLRMISSFMELLKQKYEDKLDEKALQYIHFATDGAKRMKQIILDLLEYSKATKHAEGKEDVDMNDLLHDFKLLRRKIIEEKSAIITSSELPTLNTYKAALSQVIHCLLDNALKYTFEDKPPQIEILAEESDMEWTISIIDNGIGIKDEFFEKIFVIFQRLNNRDEYTGTGIGLSIAKRHVEFLGGKIWLTSEAGQGTTFYFTIPKNQLL